MAANTNPIFTNVPVVIWSNTNGGTSSTITSSVTVTTNTAYDGSLLQSYTIFSGASPNGSFLQKVICEANGTNAVSVLRLFLNNGSVNTSPQNNALILQFSLPTSTASTTVATPHVEIPVNLQVPSGYKVLAQIGAAANLVGGWVVTGVGGSY